MDVGCPDHLGIDMVAAWSVDRLGRSLTGLLELLTAGISRRLRTERSRANERQLGLFGGIFGRLGPVHTGTPTGRAQGRWLQFS
jgi:hypothetical protein